MATHAELNPAPAGKDIFVVHHAKDDEALHVVVSDDEADVKPDWTLEEEAAAKRKVDMTLLPILILAFFALQLDRGNIGNALTDTITEDLNTNTNGINVGTQLLSAGIVILEIPSNIILQKVGPQKWLSFQILAWGLVATFQAFIKNYAGYLATRLLLGLLEAGFIPGALYILSTWYKKTETSLRIAIFFLGNIGAAATSSLIAAGILQLAGTNGLSGWRWLFLIEGIITIFIGFIFLLFIPPAVGNGRALITFGKWSYFTERESYILKRRVILDDPVKAHGGIKISGKDVWDTVKNPRVFIHFMISLLATTSVNGIASYGPSLIKSLGFSKIKANAMASIGIYCAGVNVVILGFLADRTRRRGPPTLIAATWALIAYSCLKGTTTATPKMRRFAAVAMSQAVSPVVHIINVGWLAVNCTSPQMRSVSMAVMIMSANCAGISGAQVFRSEDKPLYRHAFSALVAMAAFAWVFVVAQIAWYYSSNKKLEKITGERVPTVTEQEDGTGIAKRWWWTW